MRPMYGSEIRFKVNCFVSKTLPNECRPMCNLLWLGPALWQWRQGYDAIANANVTYVS